MTQHPPVNQLTLSPRQAKALASLDTTVIVEETNLTPGILAVRNPARSKTIQLLDRAGKFVELNERGINPLP